MSNQSFRLKKDIGNIVFSGNTINCNASIKAPFDYNVAGTRRSLNGIVTIDPNQGRIGNTTLVANTFNNLYCGINVQTTTATYTVMPKIIIDNNQFQNISNFDAISNYQRTTILQGFSKGTAIFSNVTNTNSLEVELPATTANKVNKFLNCDKGIALQGAKPTIKAGEFTNCLIGIYSNLCKVPTITISNTVMSNVVNGIAVYAPYQNVKGTRFVTITANTILTANAPLIKQGSLQYKFPIGISLFGTANMNLNNCYSSNSISLVSKNIVTMPCERGICYYFYNINNPNVADGNNVSFNEAYLTNLAVGVYNSAVGQATNTYTLNVPGVPVDSQVCYLFENCTGGFCNSNKAVGNYRAAQNGNSWNVNNSPYFKSTGYLFYKSKDIYISCNNVNHTTRGFVAKGDCKSTGSVQTPYTFGNNRIKENKCNANRNPWYFEDDATTATVGDFGQIGTLNTVECDNHFLDAGTGTILDWRQQNATGIPLNLYRHTNVLTPNGILNTTAALCLQANSGSSNNASSYQVFNHTTVPAQTAICPSSSTSNIMVMGSYKTADNQDRDLLNEDDAADDVVGDSIGYATNPVVLNFMADQDLYSKLDADPVLRNSQDVLLAFYNANRNSPIGVLHDADLLYFSTFSADMDIHRQTANWYLAQLILNSLNTTVPHIALQRDAMLTLLNTSINGIEDVTEADWDAIQTTALLCPAAFGKGVYIARSLYASHSIGTVYNDNSTCNMYAGTSYKKAVDAPDQDVMIQDDGHVLVYPNPATNSVTISYNCISKTNGTFVIYDIMGKTIIDQSLPYGSNQIHLDVSQLPAGLYIYKAQLDGCGAYTGKLQIK